MPRRIDAVIHGKGGPTNVRYGCECGPKDSDNRMRDIRDIRRLTGSLKQDFITSGYSKRPREAEDESKQEDWVSDFTASLLQVIPQFLCFPCCPGNNITEMGASYIHGPSEENPLFCLARDYGLLDPETLTPENQAMDVDECPPWVPNWFSSAAQKLSAEQMSPALEMFIELVSDTSLFKNKKETPWASIGHFIRSEARQRAAERWKDKDKTTRELLLCAISALLKAECCNSAIDSMDQMDPVGFSLYKNLSGLDCTFPGGFEGLVKSLMSELPRDLVTYSRPVRCVHWNNTESGVDSVMVECDDGERIAADHVILTVPLGYLKKHHSTLFCPPLPPHKLHSIQKLGFGTCNKIYVEFESPWWDADCEVIYLVWKDEEDILDQVSDISKSWIRKMSVFSVLKPSERCSHVLCGWIAGRESEYMEALPEQEVRDTITELFHTFTGNPTIVPKRILRSQWFHDRWTCGSYCHPAIGCSEQDLENMMEPLPTKGPQSQVASSPAGAVCWRGDSSVLLLHGPRSSPHQGGEKLIDLSLTTPPSVYVATQIKQRGTRQIHKNTSCPCCPQEANMRADPQVVIVGCGISGVAAAHRLVNAGFRHVRIVEASARSGGRIKTSRLGDNIVEIGANWIHGPSEENPVFCLARQYGLLDPEALTPENQAMDVAGHPAWVPNVFSSSGRKLSAEDLDPAREMFAELLYESSDFQSEGGEPWASVGDFIRAEVQERAAERWKDVDAATRSLRLCVISNMLKVECSINGCPSMGEVGLGAYGLYKTLPGLDCTFPRGYESLIRNLMSELPGDLVTYNQPVRCVHWNNTENGNNTVTVECDNGERIAADHVILTVPLGYLKRHHSALFRPPLPLHKLHSVQRLGFGTNNKIFVEFDSPWWDADCEVIHFVWEDEDAMVDQVPDIRTSWIKKLFGFTVLKPTERFGHVLCGWIAGHESEYMETLSEQEVSHGVTLFSSF
ncbi:hypothetical protein L3Q82_011804 [Scortum barcoo]|uniref:Uncharacterized protein n=1 Tax=Scortum barcoo TaxID=214431 RepID=A0ACB8W570_9TELE|nr:hypothetical protein L3Q82_011804 [Scortum barcoo]